MRRPPVLTNPRSERIRKVRALGGRSARKKTGRILVEGPQAVRELVTHRGGDVVDVYFEESLFGGDLYEAASLATRWVHLVDEDVARAISPDCQGVAAVAKVSAIIQDRQQISSLPVKANSFAVALPETQDPGNAGTIIRSAAAFGAEAIFLGKGSVDPTNPKVIRSSTGSVFQVPIFTVDLGEAASQFAGGGATVLGAAGGPGTENLDTLLVGAVCLEGGSLDFAPANPLVGTHIWVFGNEARGLSRDVEGACDLLVSIPIAAKVESLNAAAAAAICLHASHLSAEGL